MEGLWRVVRGIKAGSNVRFQHGDLLLDLSYITDRVIGKKLDIFNSQMVLVMALELGFLSYIYN